MPKIAPFRAYRYRSTNQELSQQVCPPYDIIDFDLELKLKKNTANAVRIELPSGNRETKYNNALAIWKQWVKNNVVRQDETAAFYVYEQKFSVGKKHFSRTGFFCELTVEKPGEGSVLRHELTLAGPKLDRLKLLRALQLNSSPIFGLFPDKKQAAKKIFQNLVKQSPLSAIKDSDGVEHQLWACTDRAQIETLQQIVAENPVAIADGHHRYETAWNYSQESAAPGAKSALFFLCPMDDPGLVIFPTHRIVKRVPKVEPVLLDETVRRAIAHGSLFKIKKIRTVAVPPHLSLILTDGKQHFSIAIDSQAILERQYRGKIKDFRELSLNHIHDFLLPYLKKEDFLYSHDLKETMKLVKKNRTFAVLVPPVSTTELFNIVCAKELMPQKSTYFYPKIITGILFRAL